MDESGTTPQDTIVDWDNIQLEAAGISVEPCEHYSDDHASIDSLSSQDSFSSDDLEYFDGNCNDENSEFMDEPHSSFDNSAIQSLENEKECAGDEQLRFPRNNSESDNEVEVVEFDEERDMKDPKLLLGMKFSSVSVFRKALKEHAIKEGYIFNYIKNESSRVTAECLDKCGWRIHASKIHNTTTFQIKSLKWASIQKEHTCPRKYYNKWATSTWLSERYLERLTDDPNWKSKGFKRCVRREHMLNVSSSQIYRAKRKALEVIEGNYREQYMRLWDYCEMVRRQNPGSKAVISVDRPCPNSAPFFQRLFLMYEAQRKGFLEGCRPMIGLDACHLKGPFGGQLMHAVARDGNNQLYPIAIAVVEAECKVSWLWFLEQLTESIGTYVDMGWTFISDRQKGLREAFEELMPGVDHRFCVRHLYANFKLLFKDKELKDLLWGAASAYTVEEWRSYMNTIHSLNKDAHDWLMKESPVTWARSHFSPRSKSDMLSNNVSESFNNYIKEARDKPIITLLEIIRRLLMTRYQNKREMMTKWTGRICPLIESKVEELKRNARNCEVVYAGDGVFEVAQELKNNIVDIRKRACTCRRWDLTGIPCVHAVAAIIVENGPLESYVHQYYFKETYALAYMSKIIPIPDQSLWVRAPFDPIMPPPLRRPPGRPKKLRKKSADEPKNSNLMGRKFQNLNCSNCGQPGHNIRTCKGPVNQRKSRENKAQSGNRGGRPRTNKQSVRVSNVNESATPRGGGRGRGRGRGSVSTGGNPIVNGRTFTGACPYSRRNEDGPIQIGSISNTPCSSVSVSSSIVFGQTAPNISTTNIDANQVIRRSTRFGEVLFSTQGSQNLPPKAP